MSESISTGIPHRARRPCGAAQAAAGTLHTSSVPAAHEAQLVTFVDARALHARLSNPRSGDLLAARFSGLVIERRTRLLTFLADARRRAALAGAR